MTFTTHTQPLGRRGFLGNFAASASGFALAQLLSREGLLAVENKPQPIRPQFDPARPFAARPSHFPAKAEQVLLIFCAGAVSQFERRIDHVGVEREATRR